MKPIYFSGKMKPQLVTKENVKSMLAAGEFFGIEDVKEEAAIFMAKNLDVENAVDVMTNEIFVGSISNNAFTFVGHNFQVLVSFHSILHFSPRLPHSKHCLMHTSPVINEYQ